MAPDRSRFDAAIAAIDAANADDPDVVVVDGEERPKEQAHAEMMTAWVTKLDPDADEAQLLAARAHHLRRWVVPRSDYPDGRAGYLRWRTAQKRRHAEEVAEIMAGVGYDPEMIEAVQRIVRKEGLGRTDGHGGSAVPGGSAPVQVHEDALALVFLQTQFRDLIDRLGPAKSAEVVRKTLDKMSSDGQALAATLPFAAEERSVMEAAQA